jgi:hypothetical protein
MAGSVARVTYAENIAQARVCENCSVQCPSDKADIDAWNKTGVNTVVRERNALGSRGFVMIRDGGDMVRFCEKHKLQDRVLLGTETEKRAYRVSEIGAAS